MEEGSHSDLLKKGGLYATLVRKQMVAEEAESEIQNESDDLCRSHSNSETEWSQAAMPELGDGTVELHHFLKTPVK